MPGTITFTVLSLFPEVLQGFFSTSIMARSIEKGLVAFNNVNIRDHAVDKHRTCDDMPYGGGPGMVFKPEPLARALDAVGAANKHVVYMTPGGALFNQERAKKYSEMDEIVILCGRYEGIDQRIIDEYVDDEVSIGDYVLSSGETAALVVIDAVYRLREGIINEASLLEESHTRGLLEYPHYTRPADFHGREVPQVLLSGHHAAIERWRLEKSIEKTLRFRPELLDGAVLSESEKKLVISIEKQSHSRGGSHGSDQGD